MKKIKVFVDNYPSIVEIKEAKKNLMFIPFYCPLSQADEKALCGSWCPAFTIKTFYDCRAVILKCFPQQVRFEIENET